MECHKLYNQPFYVRSLCNYTNTKSIYIYSGVQVRVLRSPTHYTLYSKHETICVICMYMHVFFNHYNLHLRGTIEKGTACPPIKFSRGNSLLSSPSPLSSPSIFFCCSLVGRHGEQFVYRCSLEPWRKSG